MKALTSLQWGHRLPAVEMLGAALWRLQALELQWGHRLPAVEIWDGCPDKEEAWDTSMGPPPSGSGNSYLCLDSDFRPCSRAIFAS